VNDIQIYGVELEIWLGLAAAVGAGAIWGLKKYQQINADGKITLDEVLGAVEEGEKFADKIVDAAEDLEEALETKKKAELIAIAKEKGLSTTGTKADLIERISGAE